MPRKGSPADNVALCLILLGLGEYEEVCRGNTAEGGIGGEKC